MDSVQLAKIQRNIDLVYVLVRRNLKIKYQGSVLGFFWALLQPALTAMLLIAVFTYIVRIPIDNYWAFLLSGFIVWGFLQQCINAGSLVFSEHCNVVRSIAMPKELLVVSAVLSRLVEFLAALFVVLLIIVFAHHQSLPGSFFTLPLLIVFQIFLAAGIAFPMGIISVWYRDVQHALPVLLMALFYVCPVFYPITMVPEEGRFAYQMNPIAQVLKLYHVVLYDGTFPSILEFFVTAISSLLVLAIGYIFYCRYQNRVAEIV